MKSLMGNGAVKKHYQSFFENNKKKTSEIWKGIRGLVNTSKSKSSSFKLLGATCNLLSDKNIIAKIFNNYFFSIGDQVAIRIPQ